MDNLATDQTVLHPLGLIALAILGVATLVLPRRYTVVPITLMACFIPSQQRLVVFSFDLTLFRLMIVFGWLRLILRKEYRGLRWRTLDTLVVLQPLALSLVMSLRTISMDGLVFALGTSFDALGMYLLFRVMLRSWRDIDTVALSLAIISVPVACAFIVEASTGRNAFSIFGGVQEYTAIRWDRMRCQGAFTHPILAGCFWASLLPFLALIWWRRPSARWLACAGIGCALTIILLTASSTPLGGVAAAAIGASFFGFRRHMRSVRWGVALLLLGLHFVMKAPVWALLSRIDLVGGSTGWHRYHLINQAIAHFGEWWLLGTDSTSHWGHLTQDITNHYLLIGVRGGLLALGLFIAVLALGFQAAGRLITFNRHDRRVEVAAWALGCALFAHVLIYLAVSYSGPIILAWYLPLASIGALSSRLPRHAMSRRKSPTTEPRLVETTTFKLRDLFVGGSDRTAPAVRTRRWIARD